MTRMAHSDDESRLPAPSARPRRPSIALWSVPSAPDDAEALKHVFEDGRATDVSVCRSMAEWCASDADLLLLRGTSRTGLPYRDAFLAAHDFTPLQGRRVLGIGGEAGRAFGALGLCIQAGLTATFRRTDPAIVLGASGLVAPVMRGERVAVSTSAESVDLGGLHLPPTSDLLPFVDVVARCASDPNYAPIARQQKYVFCGVGSDARTWSESFCGIVRELAIALARRPLEDFSLPQWDVTPPGAIEFELASGSDAASAHERAFRFQFERPTLISAELDIVQSGATMLAFHADHGHRDMRRIDGKAGGTLRTMVPIAPGSIRANRDRYWQLRVVNFDGGSGGRYRLRIAIEADAVVRFRDGLMVSMADPPSDAATIERLVDHLGSGDAETSARAEAALVIVGRAALPALQSARDTRDGMRDRCLGAVVAIDMLDE